MSSRLSDYVGICVYLCLLAVSGGLNESLTYLMEMRLLCCVNVARICP